MVNWFKKHKIPKDIRNAAGLSDELVKLLAEDFGRLGQVRSGFADRVLRYVLDGEEDGILSELRRSPGCGKALDLICYSCSSISYDDDDTARARFFKQAAMPDHEFLLRLARVYDAASCSSPRALFGKYLPPWLEVFLLEATRFTPNILPPRYINTALRADVVERMLVTMELEPDLLVHTALIPLADDWGHWVPKMCSVLSQFDEAIVRHAHVVHEALGQTDVKTRVYALEVLNELSVSVEPLAEVIADQALCSSGKVRVAAWPIVKRCPEAFAPIVTKAMASGKPAQRAQAARLLYDLIGEKAVEALRARLDVETAGKVKQEIAQILSRAETTHGFSEKPEFDLAPLEPVDPVAPLPESVLSQFRSIAPHKFADRCCRILQGLTESKGNAQECVANKMTPYDYHTDKGAHARAVAFARLPEISLAHLMRLLALISELSPNGVGYQFDDFIEAFASTHGPVSLRELASVFSAIGLDPLTIARQRLASFFPRFLWEDALVWPYFAEHPDVLEYVLGVGKSKLELDSWQLPDARRRAYDLIRMFPHVPQRLVPALWDIALGESKTERPLARKCLEDLPDKKSVLLNALKSGKQVSRAVAAGWLADLRDTDAIPAIKAALAKEKQELARVAMMDALGDLGVPLAEFMSLDQLIAEAQAGLEKGVPPGLSWFPFGSLPAVYWLEGGGQVPPEVVKWWICQHCKLNDPEAGALLLRYCSLLRLEDRHALGQFILSAWIERDTTAVYTRDQAEKLARKQAPGSMWLYPGRSLENVVRALAKGLLDECQYSAIKEKGILAVVAACGGPGVVQAAERYIKRWYGIRAAQCKALIRMLGWVDDRSATQVLLQIAKRFRTKGIQEEADACVRALAERNGWTTDELADRTIPTAGFDEGPEVVLDYGSRKFTASLDRQLKLVFRNGAGEPISSLPDAGKSDDEDMVKAAKDKIGLVRKELKNVLKAQKDRLYEAMCTQRTWRFEDWNEYLNNHPIVRSHCQCLVWTASDGDIERTFRPLDDGTLTSCSDEQVSLSADASIRVAHSVNTPEEERERWIEHLKDYEVTPLLDQFGKPVYALPENLAPETELAEFRGYMIKAFKLRARALGLGYTRGEIMDGPSFCEYFKHLPGLEIDAVIEFSGNGMPEEDVVVALRGLQFRRIVPSEDRWSVRNINLPLGDVPAVLLSECRNDMRIIAAEGSGFDKDWESKVPW